MIWDHLFGTYQAELPDIKNATDFRIRAPRPLIPLSSLMRIYGEC